MRDDVLMGRVSGQEAVGGQVAVEVTQRRRQLRVGHRRRRRPTRGQLPPPLPIPKCSADHRGPDRDGPGIALQRSSQRAGPEQDALAGDLATQRGLQHHPGVVGRRGGRGDAAQHLLDPGELRATVTQPVEQGQADGLGPGVLPGGGPLPDDLVKLCVPGIGEVSRPQPACHLIDSRWVEQQTAEGRALGQVSGPHDVPRMEASVSNARASSGCRRCCTR